jgi:hypothetical protein
MPPTSAKGWIAIANERATDAEAIERGQQVGRPREWNFH